MSNFGNQCIVANPILTWKEKNRTKNWSNLAKLGQTLGQKFFNLKKSSKMSQVHGKSCLGFSVTFFLTLAKSWKLRFCQTVNNQPKNSLAWFSMHVWHFVWLFEVEKFLTQNLAKFGQIFFPFTSKWDLPRCIDSQSLTCLSQLVQKLFHLVLPDQPRPFSFWPCGL